MSSPLISVIMPAYNCSDYIRQSIDSVLNQTYSNIELLIADDCSTDSTKKIIDSYSDPRIKTYHNEANLGYLKTSNKLFTLCTGEYIAFQDADDFTTLDRLETQFAVLANDSSIGVCGCNLLFIDTNGKEQYCSRYFANAKEIINAMQEVIFEFSPNTFLFKREILETVGGYNEYFNRIGAEDYYWTVLIMEKYKLVNIPGAMYYYRLNPESITGNLTDNPKKLISGKMVSHLLKQRLANKTDDLQSGNIDTLNTYVTNELAGLAQTKSQFLYTLAKRYYYNNNKPRGIKLLFKAILAAPLKGQYYKDLIYFLKNKNE
jgi:glycosyltransferase involved in cell wall biosynthesis